MMFETFWHETGLVLLYSVVWARTSLLSSTLLHLDHTLLSSCMPSHENASLLLHPTSLPSLLLPFFLPCFLQEPY